MRMVLMHAFGSIRTACRTSREGAAVRDLYSSIPPVNSSEQVLAAFPDELGVVRSANLSWTDPGEASRLLALPDGEGIKPEWTHAHEGQASHCEVAV